MGTNHTLWFITTVVLAGSGVLVSGCASAVDSRTPSTEVYQEPGEVYFRFDPPDGQVNHGTWRKTTEQLVNGLAMSTEILELKFESIILRSSRGYDISHRIQSITREKNGQILPFPFLPELKKIEFAYVLDRRGQMNELKGIDTLFTKIRMALGPQLHTALAAMPFLREDNLKQILRQAWHMRVGEIIEKRIEIGESWDGIIAFPMGESESITYHYTNRLIALVPCEDSMCASINFMGTINSEEMEKLVAAMVVGLLAGTVEDESNVKLSNMTATINGERIMEPMTSLIHWEIEWRNTSMHMEIPGRISAEVVSRTTVEREYQFESNSR